MTTEPPPAPVSVPVGDGDLREQIARALDESLSDFISPDEVGGGCDVDIRQAASIAVAEVYPLLAERDTRIIELAADRDGWRNEAQQCDTYLQGVIDALPPAPAGHTRLDHLAAIVARLRSQATRLGRDYGRASATIGEQRGTIARLRAEHDQAIEDWGRNDERVLTDLTALAAEVERLRCLVGSEDHVPAEWVECPRDEAIRLATVLRRTVDNLNGEVERLRGELTSALADALGVTTDGTPASYYQLVQAVVDLRAVRDSLVRDLELALWPGDPAVDRPLDTRWNAALTEVRGRTEQLDVTRAVLSAVHVALIEAVDDPWLGWSELPRAVATLSSRDTTPPQDAASEWTARLASLAVDLCSCKQDSCQFDGCQVCIMLDDQDDPCPAQGPVPGVSVEDTTPAPRVWTAGDPEPDPRPHLVRDRGSNHWYWNSAWNGWIARDTTSYPNDWGILLSSSGPLTEVPVSPQEDTSGRYAGSDSDRQSVGLQGHCDDCAEMGHVAAHPELGCADVGCDKAHDEDTTDWKRDADEFLASTQPLPEPTAGATGDEILARLRAAMECSTGDDLSCGDAGCPVHGDDQPRYNCPADDPDCRLDWGDDHSDCTPGTRRDTTGEVHGG